MNQEGFDQHLGYEYVSSDQENSHLKLEIKQIHRNLYGYVHGGLYYSISDAACGFVVKESKGNWVTLNGSINYLKAEKQGILDVYAKRISHSSKTSIIDVSIYNQDILVTKGTFTMYNIDKK